jgi:hypothetical protein
MENKKITEYISKLIKNTKDKKITWQVINQNLVRWSKEDPNKLKSFMFTLQKINSGIVLPGQSISDNFIFSIQSFPIPESLLQINTLNQPELIGLLRNLFDEAMSASRDSSEKTLDKLFGSL